MPIRSPIARGTAPLHPIARSRTPGAPSGSSSWPTPGTRSSSATRWPGAPGGLEGDPRRPDAGDRARRGPGPLAVEIVTPLTDIDLGALRYYAIAEGTVAGIPALVARTGYTGEDGFEIFVDTGRGRRAVGRAAEAAGAARDVPVGLARATRSASRPGCPCTATTSTTTNPYEAGLGWVVKLDKPEDFVGRAALRKIAEDGPPGVSSGSSSVAGGSPGTATRSARRRRDRRRHERHPVADPRRPDRDGLRRAGDARPGTMLAVEVRDSTGPGRGRVAAVLPPGSLTVSRRPSRPVAPGGQPADGPGGSALHQGPRVGPRRGDIATVGITAFAAEQLGDIVFVELPDAGRDARAARDVRGRRERQGGQ